MSLSLSIVVPTRHRADLLARCLRAISLQAAGLASVVVTDDGTLSIAERIIADRIPWVRWVAGPRRGPGPNRNHGARVAGGDWLVFLDDDCVPSPGWLAAYAAAVRPGVEVYLGPTLCHDWSAGFRSEAPHNPDGKGFISANFMISRRLFERIGGFDEAAPPYAVDEDTDFGNRLLAAGRPWAFVPDAVVEHPPRPRVTGAAAGRRWENRVYFEHKWTGRTSFRRWLPQFVVKVRLAEMRQWHRPRDYPQALHSLAAEWWHVMRHVAEWERKHVGNPSLDPATTLSTDP